MAMEELSGRIGVDILVTHIHFKTGAVNRTICKTRPSNAFELPAQKWGAKMNTQKTYISANGVQHHFISAWSALLIFIAALLFCALLSILVERMIDVRPGNQINLRSGGLAEVVKPKPDSTVEPVHMGISPIPSK